MEHQDGARTTSQSVVITVPGLPRGKARPRVTRFNTYTPDPGGWVADVTARGMEAVNQSGWEITNEPVAMQVSITRQIPKGRSKKARMEALGKPVSATADLINIVAAICDGLENVVYANDRQVARIESDRVWGEQHTTIITVSTIKI